MTDWISLLGQILVFAGLIFAVIKFAKEKQREFKKRFFEEQLKVFTDAVDFAAIISLHDKNEDEYIMAAKNFNRLYWGKMCIVEDQEVEAEMVKFKRLLDEYNKENDRSRLEGIKAQLQQAALRLAHTCRNTTLQTWEIKSKLEGYNDYTLESEKETSRN